MLKLINDTTGTYRLIIEYKEKEYNYIAKCMRHDVGEELWWIWTGKPGNRRILRIIYNTARKELREDLMGNQPRSIPDDFMEVMRQSFIKK